MSELEAQLLACAAVLDSSKKECVTESLSVNITQHSSGQQVPTQIQFSNSNSSFSIHHILNKVVILKFHLEVVNLAIWPVTWSWWKVWRTIFITMPDLLSF